jgi:hypothetical protein
MRSELMSAFALAVLSVSPKTQSRGQVRQRAVGLALGKFELHNVKAEPATYSGRATIRVTYAGPAGLGDAGRLAIVPGSSFQDGLKRASAIIRNKNDE